MTPFEKHTSPMRRGSYEGQRWYKVRHALMRGALVLKGRHHAIIIGELPSAWAYMIAGGSPDNVRFAPRRCIARRQAEEFLETFDLATEKKEREMLEELEKMVTSLGQLLDETKQKMADVTTETRELVREIRGEATL